ncbi:MAG: hypothetical protein ACFFCY_00720 [Promethearchaeota archaeon]
MSKDDVFRIINAFLAAILMILYYIHSNPEYYPNLLYFIVFCNFLPIGLLIVISIFSESSKTIRTMTILGFILIILNQMILTTRTGHIV